MTQVDCEPPLTMEWGMRQSCKPTHYGSNINHKYFAPYLGQRQTPVELGGFILRVGQMESMRG